ncbi:hypothetical protein ACFV6G_11035 [Streptomyces lavendulae]|uniref:hypothetical protein n=1 Tax=Streptomyces lavendulae TaxID=1914 RepID=UPI0036C53A9C
MTKNSICAKRPAAAAALVPLFMVVGLLLGPAASAEAAVPAARQAPAATALAQNSHPAGAGTAAGLRAPTSSRVQAVTGDKKGKKSKKSKKKGGFFKTLMIIVLVVIVLLVVLFVVRRALRRRSA